MEVVVASTETVTTMDPAEGLKEQASTMEAVVIINTAVEILVSLIKAEMKVKINTRVSLNISRIWWKLLDLCRFYIIFILSLGYNNDYKPSFNNGRGGFQKRNDFRNDRNGDQQSGGGFFRAKPEYQQSDDFGGNRGGYRSVSS